MITTLEKVLFLKEVSLFRNISSERLAKIATIAKEVEFLKGDKIINEGDEGDSLFIIVEGNVSILKGKDIIAKLGPRDFFGEMAILDSEPRSASVIADSEIVCLKISREDFTEILIDEHEIMLAIIRSLVHRLRQSNLKTEKKNQ
ncbi:MAG: cyclic nucleotide-binding domain-containing protein [Deltaproteobacteria bacterium]|nr:cyclic nucleotide-binding domain-containing protein [Deltaproteobacteria bacterium]